ncbi:MAG: hypothetical protein GT601_17545 [Acidaminobacter sp.]|uniref:LPD38 domain-containing protein n=1 Tax=Acidaminobacter sp. TaxID=1872102 RepID=UPI0013852D4E|nr:LPD38 domain-containing protein [Acidaminobacter sp.]MZQ99474.1 hypothetical protein [Acidaminobacter sp.]
MLIRDDDKSKKKQTEYERFVQSRKTDEFERFKSTRYNEPKGTTVESIAPQIENPLQPKRQGFVTAPRITPATIQDRMEKEQEEHNMRLREIEAQQKTMTSSNPLAYKDLAEQKQTLLKQAPTPDTVKKKLLVEQARTSIAANPADEDSWLTLAANTLDPQSLKQYQIDTAFKKATQDALYGDIQHEQAVNRARVEIDERFPVDGKLKVIAQSLSDWWLGTKATGNTLAGLAGQDGYNARRIETGRSADFVAGRQTAQDQLNRGAEQFEQAGINREAVVGEDAIKGFLYDFTSFVPDMLTTIVLAMATGATGTVAQMGAKEIGKKLLTKETRKLAMVELAKRAVISPETLPLGAKIFSQKYQSNLAEGMDDSKAFFVAFVNAYGQSVLESGGVNKAFREGGMSKATEFLKSTFGEGFEEVKQNWWEAAVDRIIAGKDIPLYSDGGNGIFDPTRDLYSFGLGLAGGAAGGAIAAPGMIADYAREKTAPQVSYDLEGYTKQVAEYEKRKGASDEGQKAKDTKYRGETYAQTELVEAADQIMDKMINYQKEILQSESNEVESMQEWEAFQDEIENTTPEAIRESILRGYASLDILDMAKEQAYKNRMPNLPELARVETIEPKKPEFMPIIDTSKMNKTVLKKMESDLALAVEDGTDQQIVDMAMDGVRRKDIAKELGVEPRMVRSVMALKGIPDTGSAAFNQWKALKTFSEARAAEQGKSRQALPVRLIDDAEVATRIANVKALTGAEIVSSEELSMPAMIGFKNAQVLGKRLGADVVFYRGGRANTRGMFSARESNTIFINSDETNDGKVVLDVLGHEFLHHVNTKHNDLYKKLRAVVGDSMTTEKIKNQLAKYAQDTEYQERLANDRELLIEEMLAEEAGSLFTDRQFWQNLYERDATTAQKLVRVIRDLINKVLKGDKKESGNLGVMTEMQIKEFQKQFEDVVTEIMGRDSVQNAFGLREAASVDIESGSAAPIYSVRTWTPEAKEAAVKGISKKLNISREKVLEWLESVDNAMAIVINNIERLDYDPNPNYTALKDNQDYGKSLDFSTLCKKRLILQGTIEAIQKNKGSALSVTDYFAVRKALLEAGKEVSCGICYVDTRRSRQGQYANEFIEKYPDLDPELFLSQEGFDRLYEEHPDVYKEFKTKLGASAKIKMQESRTEYSGEILKSFKNKRVVERFNADGGLRWQSWSDFEVPHLLDAMQAIADMSSVGLKGFAYTKMENFVRAMGNTGMMINTSLMPLGETGMKNGKPVFDGIEGMAYETAVELRRLFSNTVGTTVVGINDDHIRALMAMDTIDNIIPYHISGLSRENRATQGQGFERWQDYTTTQNESVIDWEKNQAAGGQNHKDRKKQKPRKPDITEWWDINRTPQENQKAYLELCKSWGLEPKFKQFSNEHNYWKVLTEFKMVNNEGRNISQEVVKPFFNDKAIAQIFSEYKGGHRSLPVDEKVVKRFSYFKSNTKVAELVSNLKVSEVEAHMGAAALNDFEAKFSTLKTKTIARDYTKKFLADGKVDLVGKTVKNTNELAVMAQVLRDPRFETMRIFFVDDTGKIVSHTGVSSRMPGSSAIFAGKDDKQKNNWINTQINFAKSMDATGFYLMHNHPSGVPNPSGPDFDATRRYEIMLKDIVEFKGHIIINSNQYAVIPNGMNKDNDFYINDLYNGEDKLLKPDKPHALLGHKVGSSTDMVALGQMLKSSEGYSTIFYMSPRLTVRGIQEIPSEMALEPKKLMAHLKKNAIEFGGHRPVLVAENDHVFESARHLIDDHYLFEVVDVKGERTAHGTTNVPRPNVWQGRKEGVGESAWENREKFSVARKEDIEQAFKDSKVRNDDGSLKQVYHGTGAEFTVFDASKGGKYTGSRSAKLGFFFTDNPRIADTYRSGNYDLKPLEAFLAASSDEDLEYFAEAIGHANHNLDGSLDREETIGSIMWEANEVDKVEGIDGLKDIVRSVNSIGSSLYSHNQEGWKTVEASMRKGYGKRMDLYLNITNPYVVENSEFFQDDFYSWNIAKAKELGHDGVIFKEVSDAITSFDEKDPPVGDVYVTFSSSQIKQEIGDNPVDTENPDIRFSIPTINIEMDEKKRPRDLKGDLANLYRRVVDTNHPLNKVADAVRIKAANSKLVSGTIERILTHALVDTKGRELGQSWQTITEPFATNKDFWQYMAQRHNIDRAREGKPVDPGMTPDDSKNYVANLEYQHPEYRAWGDSVTRWIDQFMKAWAVDTGIIDAHTYDEWRTMYPSYFPTYREFSDLEGGSQHGPGRRFVDLPSPVKKATGSDRDLTNPVGNVMMMVNKVVRTARYNEVGQTLLETVRSNPEAAARFAEEIPANIGMFQSKKLDNVIAVWEGGSPQYLQINDEMLLESLNGLPRIINNAPVMRKVTSVFKGLITQYNPLFALRNIFRDIPTAYVYGSQDNPLFFLTNLAKAGYEVATDSGGAALYKNLGGAGSGQFSADEATQYAKLLQPSAASKFKVPLKMIEWINNITEQAPRISEFNYILEQTGSVEKALYAAQNVTVNFARGGDLTKQAEPFVPYLNASVQGLDRFFQAFNYKKDPKGALKRMAKAGIAITVPQIASYLVSMNDDEERYQMLDQRTKDAYYVFPKGDGTFWKIPKSRELGVLWGSLFERALAGSYKGFAGTIATSFTPVDPFTSNIFAPIFWNLPVNKDFAGRAIVSQGLQKYSGKNQYDDNTSEIAKAIGRLTNLSPKQMDYIIWSYTGIIGQILLPATTKRAGVGNAVERATVGAFTADPAFSSQAMTDFYDKLNEMERVKNDKNVENGIESSVVTQEERRYNTMNKISSNLSKTTKYINANLKANDPKIQKIRTAMNNHLKKVVKATTLQELVKINAEMSAELFKLGVR